jgi:hypothetical protein
LTSRARSNRWPSAWALLKSSSIASWKSRSASAPAPPGRPRLVPVGCVPGRPRSSGVRSA